MKKLILLLIPFFLTGCYNYNELDTLGIVSSIAIDYDDKYKITVEILEDEESKTINGTGKTLAEALDNSTLDTNKTLCLSHLKTLIITPTVDIENIINYFLRNSQINNNFYLMMSDSINIYEKNKDTEIGKTTSDILKKYDAPDFESDSITFYEKNKDLLIPILSDDLTINEAYIFTNKKISTKLDKEQLSIYKLLVDSPKSFVESKCYNSPFVIEITKSHTKYTLDDTITIELSLSAILQNIECDIDTSIPKNMNYLTDKANKTIKKETEDLINYLIENSSDILGINKLIYNKYHTSKKDWTSFNYKIKVTTEINKKGLLLR